MLPKLVMTDIDGVWTDGGMYYTAEGDAMKRFSVKDGWGVSFLRRLGIPVAILTGEDTQIVRRRAEKLGIAHCYLDIESGYLQKALGKPEASFRIDLASVDGADAEILKANGFRWMRSMSGQRLAYVDFTGVARMLAGRVYDAGNPFSASISITVEDMRPEPQLLQRKGMQ